MNVRSKHCTDAQLSDVLDGPEERPASTEVADHLETCVECRQKLTRLAGAEDQWSELCEMLRPLGGDNARVPDADDPVTRTKSGAERAGHFPERLWGEPSVPDADDPVTHRKPNSERPGHFPNEGHFFDERPGHVSGRLSEHLKQFLSAPSHPEMLGRLGRYEIERVIGSGGMGVVLKGFDSELNRPVAIKLLAPHLARVGAARQRFAREARAAAAVVHEHVVAIHNVESEADVPFLVMQYVPGESLQVRVDRDGPLTVNETLRIGSQVAAGLAAAHEQGIVHRDIKPANILLEQGIERAYLTDFGLARVVDEASLTQTGIVAGTPHYMSPEQASGEASDQRSDLFSLGAVLYFMASGHPPFRAERAMGVLHRICHDRHRPLWEVNTDVPDELSVLVDQLLQKRPARRHASAEAVHERLVEVLGQVQQPGRGIYRKLRRFVLRHRRGMLVGAACVAALVTIGLLTHFVGFAVRTRMNADRGNAVRTADPTSASGGKSYINIVPVLSPQESAAFARSVDDLRERLDRLEAKDEFVSDSVGADHWSEEVQSLRQRLDRLQGTNNPQPQP